MLVFATFVHQSLYYLPLFYSKSLKVFRKNWEILQFLFLKNFQAF